MHEPDPAEAREILTDDGDEVVEAWEDRPATIEAGLDDTTAPGLPGTGDEDDGDRG